ncbi:MAG: T9SS type A sorting domain-containing protein, partial [Flavobacteriaceae bacterium]|nr:T9SS type A sorting domain-containing protein [Flavobacteriaceae bacterium]
NVATNSTIGILSATDADAANTFTYTLVAGAGSTDNASFSISGSNLTINASPNFETKSSYSVRIRTTDQGGLTFEKTFTITVNNINEAPTDIALSDNSINENVATNSTIGILSATDADAANTFTYTLVAGTGDTDNTAFAITGKSLTINASPDFETKSSYSVRIRTTDQGSLTFEKVFTITVNNVNEVPTDIALSTSAINENVAANSTVGTLSSTDTDAGSTFNYSLVTGTGDTDNAAFSINNTTKTLTINASPNFENKSSYTIRVSTSDGSLTFVKVFTITINDVCELDNSATVAAGVLTATQTGTTYQWYKCPNTILNLETNQTYTPTEVGDYKVVISSGGCTVTSNCITVATLGNKPFETNSKFVLYPNPSSGIININSETDGVFHIINQLGQTVKTFKVSANNINSVNIESLTDGVYFVYDTHNKQSHRLIIKK